MAVCDCRTRRAKNSACNCQVLSSSVLSSSVAPSSRERSPVPTERVGRDLRKAPAHGFARIVLAVLDDVVALGASDLARIDLAQRVAPEDVPRIDPRVVDAQRRAVEDAGQNSDILDGAAFEHPREMDLALAFVRGAVVAMNGCGKSPMPDQPAVEAHLAGAVDRGLSL